MDINELTIDQNLLERINPVFNTAKMTLFQLSAAGDQDAVRISDKLGLTLENTNRVSTPEEMIHNIIVLETRFRTMGALAEETGFVEVDLPCGYTPRAIEFARKGKQFVGLDLPAAIAEAKPATGKFKEADGRNWAQIDAPVNGWIAASINRYIVSPSSPGSSLLGTLACVEFPWEPEMHCCSHFHHTFLHSAYEY